MEFGGPNQNLSYVSDGKSSEHPSEKSDSVSSAYAYDSDLNSQDSYNPGTVDLNSKRNWKTFRRNWGYEWVKKILLKSLKPEKQYNGPNSKKFGLTVN